jgi:uncharacterized integral membrane protein
LLMIIKITGFLLCLVFIIIARNIALKKINNYIDNRFEIEFYNRTNKFTRIFISKNKKSELEHEYTYLYRRKAQYIANIVTIITILIIIFIAIFLQLRIK